MAVIVVAKAALEANKNVKKFVPGGWKTVIAIVLIVLYVIGTAIVNTGMAIAPFLKGGYQESCANPAVNGQTTGKNDNEPGKSTAGIGQWSTARTPWPTANATRVVYPAPNPVMTSGFGPRSYVIGGAPDFHNGQDFGQPANSPVLSIADGVVATAAAGTSPYGSHVAIKHTINGNHYTSVYGHIIGTSIKVKVGDKVKAGQQVAGVGTEGLSTGYHIHLVITQGDYDPNLSEPGFRADHGPGNSINPGPFLSRNGAKTASGGLTGTEFNGVTSDADTSCKANEDGLDGDGFSSWGGFKNGEITGIDTVTFKTGAAAMEDTRFKLMSRAATDLVALNREYRTKFGKDLIIEIAYRDLATQKALYDAGTQIESPGTSIYGWARAVKLKLAFGTPEYKWMVDNAEKFGWAQPATYAEGGSAANAGLWGYKGNGEGSEIPPAGSASAEESRAIAKKILQNDHGWGQGEYSCLVQLWEHESNWNYKAENPSSGAYGIVQALPPSKMNSVATDWKTNPATQIKWGLQYIEERYGTPCGAWDFWQETDASKKHGIPGNWY